RNGGRGGGAEASGARYSKATLVPSGLTAAACVAPLPGRIPPSPATETSVVVPVPRSRTYVALDADGLTGTRSRARLPNAIRVASALEPPVPFDARLPACVPVTSTDTSSVVSATRSRMYTAPVPF